MKSMYDITFSEVTEGSVIVSEIDEIKDKEPKFITYTNEYYDPSVTGFWCHAIYDTTDGLYCVLNEWKFRDQ